MPYIAAYQQTKNDKKLQQESKYSFEIAKFSLCL